MSNKGRSIHFMFSTCKKREEFTRVLLFNIALDGQHNKSLSCVWHENFISSCVFTDFIVATGGYCAFMG